MILFIHVPKTAGSSFRAALAGAFGKDAVALDYGKDSPETSDLVQRHIYNDMSEKPRRTLISRLRKNHFKALAGHFYCRKYACFFAAEDVVSFVREPLVRTASEYLHKKRMQGYGGTFEEFIELPANQNPQSAYLSSLPDGAFVGITERYRESLKLLNSQLGTDFRFGKHNVAPGGGAGRFVKSLPEKRVARFNKLNREDLLLYESQWTGFRRRYQAEMGKEP